MLRRTLVKSLLSVPVLASFGTTAAALGVNSYLDENYSNIQRVVQSFPKQSVVDGRKQMTHFLYTNFRKEPEIGQISLSIENVVVDNEEEYSMEKIFLDEDIDVLTFKKEVDATIAIVRAGNKIAKKTRRGNARHYSVFSDHILVWYQGNLEYDSPAQSVGKNLAYNPLYKDYFIRVKLGRNLTEEEHERLSQLNFVRI